jgi:hypothetical protein
LPWHVPVARRASPIAEAREPGPRLLQDLAIVFLVDSVAAAAHSSYVLGAT